MLKRTPCPPPVARVSDEPDEAKETENGKKVKKPNKKKKKKNKAGSDSSDKGKNPPKAKNFGTYEPGKYMTVYKAFVQEQKVNNGLSHKDAIKKWHDSHEKWELLREMPEAEKKRRRFI